jgi:hypothetical protein
MEGNAAIRGQLDQELADSSPPPLGSVVADSIVDGRRLRRRRRFVAVVGAAAGVLLLVGGGAVTAATLRGGSAAPETAGQGGPPIVANTTPATTTTTAPAAPLPSTGLTAEVVMARLIPMLPAGGTVSKLKTTTDEYGADVTFTLTLGGKRGSVVIGVVIGPDPARFICHDPKDKTCKRTVSGGVTVRSLMMGKTTIRVDAGFTGDVIVFIEADTSVLSRTQAVAIARDHTWLDHADQAEIDSATRTVEPLR